MDRKRTIALLSAGALAALLSAYAYYNVLCMPVYEKYKYYERTGNATGALMAKDIIAAKYGATVYNMYLRNRNER